VQPCIQEEVIVEMKQRVREAIQSQMKGPLEYVFIYDDYKYLYSGEVNSHIYFLDLTFSAFFLLFESSCVIRSFVTA
jgi:hypothetical protein